MEKIKVVNLPLDKNTAILNENIPWLLSGENLESFSFLIKNLKKKKIQYILYLEEKMDLKEIKPEALIVKTSWPENVLNFLICEAISLGIYIFYIGDLKNYRELEFLGYPLSENLSEKDLIFISEILRTKPIRCNYAREDCLFQIDLFKKLSLNLKDSLSHTFSLPRFDFLTIFKFKEDIIFERKPFKNNNLGDFVDDKNLLHIHLLFETPTNNKSTSARLLPKEGLCFYFRVIDENNKDLFPEENIIKIIQNALKNYLISFSKNLKFETKENDLYINGVKVFGGMTFSDPYCKVGTLGCFYIYIDFEKEKSIFNEICKDTSHIYGGLTSFCENLNPDDLALFILKKVREEFKNE